MNKRTLIKLLRKQGFNLLAKQGKGSHEKWKKGDIIITVPKPSKSDYAPGTLNEILKQAGLK